jgi:tRNA A-37 threonylcarbamoyl transferase component Bud32
MHEQAQSVDRRYVLKREIALGGIATVFEADHAYLKCSVALKRLSDAAARERLLGEAALLGRLRHPGIVRALDAGEDQGIPYLALELLDGRTLAGILAARQQLPIEDVAALGRQLGAAVTAAHEHGIVHGDIRAANVFVALDDGGVERVKLIDFALGGPAGDDAARLRSDLQALASVLYECLAGVAPAQPLASVRTRRPDTPEALARVLERALAGESKDRIADAAGFSAAWSGVTTSMRAATELLAARGTRGGARDQRRYTRAPYITPVRIVESSGAHLDGRSEDISEGGLLVFTPRECRSGDVVKCRFALPTSGRITEVSATARWVRVARGNGAVGLEFLDLAQSARDEVKQYVSLMASG